MSELIDRLKQIVIPAARDELLGRFTRVTRQAKADGSFVTEADLCMQQRLIKAVSDAFPGTLVLGEEMSVEQQEAILQSNQPFWCIDPLDGTSNFAAGIPYFAVSLSLIEQGEVSLGMVYDPRRDECFSATRDGVTELNGAPLSLLPGPGEETTVQAVAELSKSTAIIDFKRLPADLSARLVTEMPFSSQRNFGASALDWCWLAAGRGHLYLHGKQNIWDYGAGQLILEKAGGYARSFDGKPVFKNRLVPRSVIAAVNEPLFQQWVHWLGDIREL